jgi:phage polymerase
MKELSIDIETYSEVDLRKSGVYRYAEDDSFEILLVAISADNGSVTVYDLTKEDLPKDIIDAIVSDSIIKWAYNANFERVCFSNWLNKHHPDLMTEYFLCPTSWRCSMVWSAYMGLPLSLEGVGSILGLDKQKLTSGKDLIRYFCLPCPPTKVNGGRTRNFPHQAPDKWNDFVLYNKRDVEVELAIKDKLKKFPVPHSIWEEYHQDQIINDRGIKIDRDFVEAALEIDRVSKDNIKTELKQLTGLDNPNSVQQMIGWLREHGVTTDSLDKKAVNDLLKTVDETTARVLRLRQKAAKSSVSKYQAMMNCICKDGRARGMFQFYGASRTGRWCLTGDHEVLTKNGWIRLDNWNGGHIACYNPRSSQVSFQKSEAVTFPFDGLLYHYSDKRIDQISTGDHKMLIKKRYDRDWEVKEIKDCLPSRFYIPFTGFRQYQTCLESHQLRVIIMTQADGHYTNDGILRFHFSKQRKIDRCKMLLRKAEISFTEKKNKTSTTISIPIRALPLWLRVFRDKTFGYWMMEENPDIIFDELPHWDGYYASKNTIQYTTTNKQNADIIQALAHLSGRAALISKKHEDVNGWQTAYVVNIWLTPKNEHEVTHKPEIVEHSGQVHCATTPTGFFLVRRNGKVWVTGNSGRNIQLQNLPQNHLPDLEEARTLVKTGDYETVNLLYDTQDTLSQLIRTAFIPEVGKKFIVCDFSAIEARVLSHLAGETWRSKVFERGEDIYCASASKMFHVPVEKHGINSHLRQKGKIAELALGYGGSVGALKAMGALDMGLEEEELQPLVDAWRQSNPNIVLFWWDIDKAVKTAVKQKIKTSTHGFTFEVKSGLLFITLPSGRCLSYIKPKMGENQFGGESVTYEGIATGKKWDRIESYGPKFVENIVQAISRDLLAYAMRLLGNEKIVGHVHDEVILEAKSSQMVGEISALMANTPAWMNDINLRADGYECQFYQKD